MAKDLIDFSKFKKIFSDEHKTHLQHPKGHTIVVAHISLSPKIKEQLDKLPSHEAPKEMMEHALENAEHMVEHLAKGGKAEKHRIYGESGEPEAKSKHGKHHHAAQSEALNRHVERKMGLPIVESKGKFYDLERINKERKKEKLSPLTKEEIEASEEYSKAPSSSTERGAEFYRAHAQKTNPKPDWRSGNLEAQKHIGAKAHEVAHIITGPMNKRLGDFQEWMDEGSKRAGNFTSSEGKRLSGIGKQLQEEIQPMAMENPLRRRAGIPANSRPQSMSSIYGEGSKEPLRWEHPPRRALDTGEEYAIRLANEKGLPEDLIGLSKNLSPENRQRLRDYDENIIRFHPKHGMVESMSPEALINLRGQGRHEEAKHRLKTRGEERFAEGGYVDLPHYDEGGETHYYADGSEGAVSEDDDQTAPIPEMENRQPAFERQAPEQQTFEQAPERQAPERQEPNDGGLMSPEKMTALSQRRPEPLPLQEDIDNVQNQIEQARAQKNTSSETLVPLYTKLGHLQTAQKSIAAAKENAPTPKQYQPKTGEPQRSPSVVQGIAPQAALQDTSGWSGPTKQPMQAMPNESTYKQIMNPLQQGYQTELAGIQNEATALGQQGKAQAEQYELGTQALQNAQTDFNNRMGAWQQENDDLTQDYMNQKIDPMAAWNDRSVPSKISTAIGLILGGMGGGLTHQENPAMKFLQYQIDKSIEGQKMNLGRGQALLDLNLKKFHNIRDASEFTRVNLNSIMSNKILMEAAKSTDPLAKARAQMMSGKLMRENGMIMSKLNANQILNDSSSSDAQIQNSMQIQRMYDPEGYKDSSSRYVPKLGLARIPVSGNDRLTLEEMTNFETAANQLMKIMDATHQPNLSPASRADLETRADELASYLGKSMNVDLSEGKLPYLKHQIGDPNALKTTFLTNNQALKTTIIGNRNRLKNKLDYLYSNDSDKVFKKVLLNTNPIQVVNPNSGPIRAKPIR